MKNTQLRIHLYGMILVLTVMACVIPGQTISPAPVVNQGSIETSIVGTAQVAKSQTEQASLVTSTPTIPMETPTPTPTLQESMSGTSLIFHEDKSAEFIDHKAKIKLAIPAGWLPVRPNEDEYYKAFTLDVTLRNQEISNRLTRIQSIDPKFFRLDVIDIRDGHIQDGILTMFNVIFEEGDMRSLEDWAVAEKKKKNPFEGFKFISTTYPQIANGTKVLVIEQSWQSGQVNTIYYRGVFFSLPTGTVVLDFYTNNKLKDNILPDFDQIVNSLTKIDS
ncbi:MAG: hypothetical protein IPP66_02470 [Anaerolineales bacterium]|nr:hypothetical protein [Anaerolineales bacterium]